MGRPLTQVLVFFALSSVIIFLAMGEPLPGDTVNNTTISDDQVQFQADPTNQTANTTATRCEKLTKVFFPVGLACQGVQSLWDRTIADTPVGRALTTVTAGLSDFVKLMGRVITFDIPGAPYWVRFPFSMVLIGSTSYIVVSLVRGAG